MAKEHNVTDIQTVVVGGIETACLSRSDLTDLMIADCLKAREGAPCKLIFDLNGHGIALTRSSSSFREDMEKADIVHADGQPIVIASKLLTKTPIPERSATTDFFHDAAAVAVKRKLRFYLLGATEEVNEACEAKMRALYPGLEIVGRRHGYFERSEEAGLCESINALGVDVVWVGLGKPREQAFCTRNAHCLRVGWVVTCGGCFNYVTGSYSRAPNWMQAVGLEWLYRLSASPKQFSWRYLTTNPVALYMLLTQTRSGSPFAWNRA